MWKWLIGPALLGTGCVAGSVYGRDAEQVVHKSPADTYAAVEQALDNMRQSGMTSFDGGTPMPYEIRIDRAYNERLDVTLLFAGKEGAEAELDFAPVGGGKDTFVKARIHGDHGVLRSALAGTSRARLAYAPDWALNLAARPLLQQLAQQIEQGETAQIAPPMTQADAEAQWEQNLTDEQRGEVQQYHQYEATRPTTDPDADARNYMAAKESL
jgi:hypothetical protein